MTKLLLSALACFAFVATTSVVFANNDPVPQQQGQQNPQNGEQEQPNQNQNPQG